MGDDPNVAGDVSGVDVSSGTPRLIVGDQTYPLSSVLRVEPGTPATTTTSQSTKSSGA